MRRREYEDRRRELLVSRALGGLSPKDELELAGLGGIGEDPDDYELAAAALHLAFEDELEEMPADLARRLAGLADQGPETNR